MDPKSSLQSTVVRNRFGNRCTGLISTDVIHVNQLAFLVTLFVPYAFFAARLLCSRKLASNYSTNFLFNKLQSHRLKYFRSVVAMVFFSCPLHAAILFGPILAHLQLRTFFTIVRPNGGGSLSYTISKLKLHKHGPYGNHHHRCNH